MVLLFDLDGTLYRGTAHMERYARELQRALPTEERSAFLREAEAYLAGDDPAPGYDDWDSLARIARRYAADPAGMQQAFLRTRRFMMSDRCPLEVPDGLAAFLEAAGPVAYRIAMSNSPTSSVDPLLRRLGLLTHLDRTEPSAHKPHGLAERVYRVLESVSLVGVPLLSIGDHLRNDIEPAREAGWDTAYIRSRPDFPVGPATFQGPSLESLLPDLERWVRDRAQADNASGPGSPPPGAS